MRMATSIPALAALLLATSLATNLAAQAADEDVVHLENSSGGRCGWLEHSGSAPAEMPGPQTGYWSLRLDFEKLGESSEAHAWTFVNQGRPGVAFGLWKDGGEFMLDEAGRPKLAYIAWAIPEELTDEFLQFGHSDLPDFMDDSTRELLTGMGFELAPQLAPLEQRAMFEDIMAQTRELSLEGLHIYVYAPGYASAQIQIGWRDNQQPVRAPEFFRTAEERAAEQAAGLEFHRNPFPLAEMTLYLNSPGVLP